MRSRAALLLVFALSTGALADTAKWDVARTTPPETAAEAVALQNTLKSVVEKVTPSTVAIFYGAGAGSGVIVSQDGLVLTAAHVVTPQPNIFGGGGRRGGQQNTDAPIPKNIRLQLADGTGVEGVVVGRNPGTDDAMIRITDSVPKNAKWPGAANGKWPAVELGKSADLKKGQWVVALGHPGGPKKDRRAPVRLGQMMAVNGRSRIVSDCTLVGGDSGGPLFDLDGKLIGIHSSIGNDLAANNHIPTHIFERDWKRLYRGDNIMGSNYKNGPDKHDGRLGVILSGDFDDSEAKTTYNRDKAKPLIESVTDGSPADKAGLLANDFILEFKGEKVDTTEDIDQMLVGVKAGQRVLVKVRRGKDTYELEVTLDKREPK
jgi:serine protease Do